MGQIWILVASFMILLLSFEVDASYWVSSSSSSRSVDEIINQEWSRIVLSGRHSNINSTQKRTATLSDDHSHEDHGECASEKWMESKVDLLKSVIAPPSTPTPGVVRSNQKRASQNLKFFVDDTVLISGSDPQACYNVGDTILIAGATPHICTSEDVLSEGLIDLINNSLMPTMLQIFSQLLSVKPSQVLEPLKLDTTVWNAYSQQCDINVPIPSSYVTIGLPNTDYVIFITARPTASNTTIAFAGGCNFKILGSNRYSRPYAGLLNLNPRFFQSYVTSMSLFEYKHALKTAMHEVTHALGFSSLFYNSYMNSTSTFYSPSVWFQSNVTGTSPAGQPYTQTIQKLRSPSLLRFARDYFNCSTLDGVELEEYGGGTTAGSHWERRVCGEEYMTGFASEQMWMSGFTLSLFEEYSNGADMGWYDVDRTKVEYLGWGKDKGCSFVQSRCETSWPSAGPGYWCSSTSIVSGCTADRVGYGRCYLVSDSKRSPYYQHFSNAAWGGFDLAADSCPYMYPLTSCRNTGKSAKSSYFEVYGDNSRCWEVQNGASTAFICYPFQCINNNTALQVQINSNWITCPVSGGNISVSSILGGTTTVNCPKTSLFCRVVDGFEPQNLITDDMLTSPSSVPTPVASASNTPTPTPSPTPSATTTPSVTPSATPSSSPSPSPTPSRSPSSSVTATPSITATPSSTPSSSTTPSVTPSTTPSVTATPSPTSSPTPSTSPSPSSSTSPTASVTPTTSATPSNTPSASSSTTASPTTSVTPTSTPSASISTSPSTVPSASASPSSPLSTACPQCSSNTDCSNGRGVCVASSIGRYCSCLSGFGGCDCSQLPSSSCNSSYSQVDVLSGNFQANTTVDYLYPNLYIIVDAISEESLYGNGGSAPTNVPPYSTETIVFFGPSATSYPLCSYPNGGYTWVDFAAQPGACHDKYLSNMTWTFAKENCGFTAINGTRNYTQTITIQRKYNLNGVLQRTEKTTRNLNVVFPTDVPVTDSNTTVSFPSADAFVAVTSIGYDPDTLVWTVEVQSSVPKPFSLGSPSLVSVTGSLAQRLPTIAVSGCSAVGTYCVQTITYTYPQGSVSDACLSLSGQDTHSFSVSCSGASCPPAEFNVTLHLNTGSACASTDYITFSETSLSAYTDASLRTPATSFTTTGEAYFGASIQTTDALISSRTLKSVCFQPSSGACIYVNYTVLPSTAGKDPVFVVDINGPENSAYFSNITSLTDFTVNAVVQVNFVGAKGLLKKAPQNQSVQTVFHTVIGPAGVPTSSSSSIAPWAFFIVLLALLL